jgi:hypothetical protein
LVAIRKSDRNTLRAQLADAKEAMFAKKEDAPFFVKPKPAAANTLSDNTMPTPTVTPTNTSAKMSPRSTVSTTETWSDTAKHAADVVGEQLHKVGVAVGLAEPTLAEKLSQAKEAATRPQTTDTTAAPATSTWTRE